MEIRTNFVDSFVMDLTSHVMTFLDDPADLVRASAVSRSWRHFVIANGLCQKLWLRKVPFFVQSANAVEKSDEIIIMSEAASRDAVNWGTLEREHKIYSSLLMTLAKPMIFPKDCLTCTLRLEGRLESILMRLESGRYGVSYRSSEGQSDPDAPENVLYSLNSNICIVSEVCIRPFKAFYSFWEPRKPVYSSKLVRFRFGHLKSLTNKEMAVVDLPSVDQIEWTYTSPEFPMKQEAYLQQFKLPEPVVCVGGYFQIELLGSARRDQSDGLFYICLGQVRVLGCSLEPAYDLEMFEERLLQFKFSPHALVHLLRNKKDQGEDDAVPYYSCCRRRACGSRR